ncbi:MAG: bifunctional acetate--CoA ligase family protein/GNAT family N-acetyltransferase [Burkholderiales bacterium]|nr:bifunctional acetate--CoA ligase family protein/GNAT family N-acetyltransferase [Burkholderiales bacterium]
MTARNLHFLLRPRSVAVIGASDSPRTAGGVALRNLVEGGFRGRLMTVPGTNAVAGVPGWRHVSELPEAPDLALLCTAPDALPRSVDELGTRGTRAAAILTDAADAPGAADRLALHQSVLNAAKPHLLRVLGPDSIGLLVPQINLNASIAPVSAQLGRIALISQSGALTAAALDWAAAREIGFSCVVSLGDGADVDAADLIEYLGGDTDTRAILLYIESIRAARKFLSAARAASHAKPIIVLKSGRTAHGAQAALRHTGADPGNDRVFDAALRRAGALRVKTIAELFAAAETLGRAPCTHCDRLMILTNAGGPGVIATDAVVAGGGELAALAPESTSALRQVLPAAVSLANPIDLGAGADAARYAAAIEALQSEPERNALLLINTPSYVASARTVAGACALAVRARRRAVLACWMGSGRARDAARVLQAAGVPLYETPEAAVQAFLYAAEYLRNRESLQETPASTLLDFTPDSAFVVGLLQRTIAANRLELSDPEGKALLAAYGIPVVETYFATSVDAAVSLAGEIGYPVALKVVSPDLEHRADVGGVMLDLEDAGEVRRAALDISDRLAGFRPGATLEGFTVQPMMRGQGAVHHRHGAREISISAVEDAIFGPVIHLGVTADACAVGLVPLNTSLARDMLLRCGLVPTTGGASRFAIDLDAAAVAISRVSQLLADHPQIVSLAIEPLLADENGVMALEVRTRTAVPKIPGNGRLAILPYPRHLEQQLELAAGSFLLRPIRPEDARAYCAFIARIDEPDLRRRFARSSGPLPDRDIARYTQIDYDRDMAFVAVRQSGSGDSEIVGEVRAHRYPEGPSAEFGIIVRSDLKRLGLGRALMQKMIGYCRRNGIELIGQIHPQNDAMLALAARAGMQVERPPGAQIAIAHLAGR